MTVFEISWSFLESSRVSKNSNASAIDRLVTSTTFVFSPRNTFNASGRRRAPLHTGHGSSDQKCLVPSPLHAGHAPYGELKEKRRGSTSGKENPSYAHINLVDTMRSLPASSTLTNPSASCSARSTASLKRSSAADLLLWNSDIKISSTSASISCFLYRESSTRSRRETSVPSIFAFSNPLPSRS